MPMTNPKESLLPDDFMQARYDVLESALLRLETVCDRNAIRHAANRLWSILEQHYAAEQEPSSIVTGIQEIAVHRQADILRLRQEHEEILDLITNLIQSDASDALLRAQALKLAGRVREHEAQEAQAYFDGLYTDLGGLG